MSNHSYKVETKPTFWQVELHHGEYSDHDQTSYFIRANDREEAWYLFKEYWAQAAEQEDRWHPCLVLWDSDGRQVDHFAPYPPRPRYKGGEASEAWNFDTSYGDANGVYINQLNVIKFKS